MSTKMKLLIRKSYISNNLSFQKLGQSYILTYIYNNENMQILIMFIFISFCLKEMRNISKVNMKHMGYFPLYESFKRDPKVYKIDGIL